MRTQAQMGREQEREQAREHKLAQCWQQLEIGVRAIQSGADFQRYLLAAARFHRYSANNVLLIIAQRPDATRVASYTTWQRLGRQVRRGEQAIRILAPMVARRDAAGDDGGAAAPVVRGFRLAAVFDISQTEGDDLPAVEPELLAGDGDATLYARCVVVAQGYGLDVSSDARHGEGRRSNGFYQPQQRLIWVRPNPPAQMLKTLVHELAHHLDPELLQSPAPVRETVAEAAAFAVAAHWQIDTGAYSFPYIASWAAAEDGGALLRGALARIQGITARLIGALEAGDERTASTTTQADEQL